MKKIYFLAIAVLLSLYNPQNEMFRENKTKCSVT